LPAVNQYCNPTGNGFATLRTQTVAENIIYNDVIFAIGFREAGVYTTNLGTAANEPRIVNPREIYPSNNIPQNVINALAGAGTDGRVIYIRVPQNHPSFSFNVSRTTAACGVNNMLVRVDRTLRLANTTPTAPVFVTNEPFLTIKGATTTQGAVAFRIHSTGLNSVGPNTISYTGFVDVNNGLVPLRADNITKYRYFLRRAVSGDPNVLNQADEVWPATRPIIWSCSNPRVTLHPVLNSVTGVVEHNAIDLTVRPRTEAEVTAQGSAQASFTISAIPAPNVGSPGNCTVAGSAIGPEVRISSENIIKASNSSAVRLTWSMSSIVNNLETVVSPDFNQLSQTTCVFEDEVGPPAVTSNFVYSWYLVDPAPALPTFTPTSSGTEPTLLRARSTSARLPSSFIGTNNTGKRLICVIEKNPSSNCETANNSTNRMYSYVVEGAIPQFMPAPGGPSGF
jgi:hypothetical protein